MLNVCRSDKKIDAKKHENAVLSLAKRNAISYKTQCYLLQNAIEFAVKSGFNLRWEVAIA